MMTVRRLAFFLLVVNLFLGVSCELSAGEFKYRWVYFNGSLSSDAEVQKLINILGRAKKAGYNGVVLADQKLQSLERANEKYLINIGVIKMTSEQLGIEIYPLVGSVGNAGTMLPHDSNLYEGMPVKKSLFVARKGQVEIVADPPLHIRGGDFEQSQGNKFAGWDMEGKPMQTPAADRSIRHGGNQSLRIELSGKNDSRGAKARISQTVEVAPYRQYHLSAWIKTENLASPERITHKVTNPAGQPLSFSEWDIKRNQDWTRYHTLFNSQTNTQVRFNFAVLQGKKEGKIWIDDVTMEETAVLNPLRRQGCPFLVKGEDGSSFREGRDFELIRTGRQGAAGRTETYHQSHLIRILPGSRISEGQRLRVSYNHAATTNKGKQSICLTEPKGSLLLQQDIESVDRLLKPKGLFLNYTEIRVANWCDACRSRNMSPGSLLADHINKTVKFISSFKDGRRIFVWSDMFDPYHNAVDHYYLANGSWAGSWKGLSSDVTIVNWNFAQKNPDSLKWFANLGHSQILAGYFDGNPQMIKKWLDTGRDIPNITGVMYTTLNSRYEELENFARWAWGEK